MMVSGGVWRETGLAVIAKLVIVAKSAKSAVDKPVIGRGARMRIQQATDPEVTGVKETGPKTRWILG